ncbi:two-component sensor histidine kinase, partial [Klebsiella pneumoniae]
SVAILDRLPAAERPQWLPKLARGNYRYLLDAGERGDYPASWRARDAARSLQEALSAQYPVSIVAIPGPRQHIQAHITLHDGAPLTLDLWPKLPAIARWLPVVLIAQFVLLLACAWYAVRQVLLPISRFTHAVMAEQGPEEVRRAARAFNAMQARIHDHLQERARILAAISHDLQTPITRMKLRVEMADQPELRDKLLQDLDNMTRLVREGIAFARTSQPLEEARQRLNLDAFLDTIVCDYADVGRPVQFCPEETAGVVWVPPQALRRVMTNLIDNALKFGTTATVTLTRDAVGDITLHVLDEGPGIPEASLQEVLQPFYRLEDSRNRDTGGTGLGLAIAAQLVSQMDGALRLANRPQGGLDASVRLAAAGLYPDVSSGKTDN